MSKIKHKEENKNTTRWYVDFESWIVEGRTGQEAEEKAITKLKTGYTPSICNLDIADEDHIEPGNDWGDGWFPIKNSCGCDCKNKLRGADKWKRNGEQ